MLPFVPSSLYHRRTITTFKIKLIPFCYVLTNFESSLNAKRHKYNTEKDTGEGRGGDGSGVWEFR